MPPTPYLIFPWDEILALVAERCPTGNLDELLPKLETDSQRIVTLPLDAPERQLLAALRRRASCLRSPLYDKPTLRNALDFWLRRQSSSSLSA